MLTAGIGGTPVMDVECCKNVLVVAVLGRSKGTIDTPREAMMTVFNSPDYESDSDAQSGTLMQFHRQLGHLCLDTIIKMAKHPALAIRLTRHA